MNSFTLYSEYFDLITLLPDEKEQADLCWKICKYMFLNEEPVLNESQMKVFKNLKRPLDKSKNQSKNVARRWETNTKEDTKLDTKEDTKQDTKRYTHQDVNVYVNSKENNKGVTGGEEETKPQTNKELYVDIIGYLNAKTGSNYKATTKKTQQIIQARLDEKFTLEDFKMVIDKKTKEWLENEEMSKYLRPETLFGTKFEGYLNQKVKEPNWFNEKVDKENMTSEEESELQEMLKKYE